MVATLLLLTNQIIRKKLTLPIYTKTKTRNLFMNYETGAFMTISPIATYDKMMALLTSVSDYRTVQWPLHLQNWKQFCCCQGLIDKIDGYDRIYMTIPMNRAITYQWHHTIIIYVDTTFRWYAHFCCVYFFSMKMTWYDLPDRKWLYNILRLTDAPISITIFLPPFKNLL